MTLSAGFGSDPASRAEEALVSTKAKAHFASALEVALGPGEIGLFVEPHPNAAFVLRQRIPIGR